MKIVNSYNTIKCFSCLPLREYLFASQKKSGENGDNYLYVIKCNYDLQTYEQKLRKLYGSSKYIVDIMEESFQINIDNPIIIKTEGLCIIKKITGEKFNVLPSVSKVTVDKKSNIINIDLIFDLDIDLFKNER